MDEHCVVGRLGRYVVEPEGQVARRGGEIYQTQLSLPLLHIWVLWEEGDTDADLWRALGGALDDVFELLLTAPIEGYTENPRACYAQTWTEYEASLCRAFCGVVAMVITPDSPTAPPWLSRVAVRFPVLEIERERAVTSPDELVLGRKALTAIKEALGDGTLWGITAQSSLGSVAEALGGKSRDISPTVFATQTHQPAPTAAVHDQLHDYEQLDAFEDSDDDD